MNIKVEKWIVDDCISYKIINIDKCCDKLINRKNISVNTEYDEYEAYDKQDYSVKLIRGESVCDGDYDYMDYYYETIEFCPFCGEKIIIEVINEINKTNEYKSLREQRELLWNKCKKTDSKKKYEELYKQVSELDNSINYLLMSDDFDDLD
jgi:DNA-directed RNA polymerase beta' subunit